MDTYFDIRRFGRLMRYDLVANSRHLAFLLIAVSVGLYALLFLNFYKAFTVTYSVGEMESRVGDIASFFQIPIAVFVRHALKYVQQVQYAISLLIQMKQKRMLLCHAVMHALPIRIFRGTYDMSEVEIMMLPQQ